MARDGVEDDEGNGAGPRCGHFQDSLYAGARHHHDAILSEEGRPAREEHLLSQDRHDGDPAVCDGVRANVHVAAQRR